MAHPYGSEYRRRRAKLVGLPCVWCGAHSTTADHIPPLSAFPPGQWVGELKPACVRCNSGNRAARAMSGRVTRARDVPRRRQVLR